MKFGDLLQAKIGEFCNAIGVDSNQENYINPELLKRNKAFLTELATKHFESKSDVHIQLILLHKALDSPQNYDDLGALAALKRKLRWYERNNKTDMPEYLEMLNNSNQLKRQTSRSQSDYQNTTEYQNKLTEYNTYNDKLRSITASPSYQAELNDYTKKYLAIIEEHAAYLLSRVTEKYLHREVKVDKDEITKRLLNNWQQITKLLELYREHKPFINSNFTPIQMKNHIIKHSNVITSKMENLREILKTIYNNITKRLEFEQNIPYFMDDLKALYNDNIDQADDNLGMMLENFISLNNSYANFVNAEISKKELLSRIDQLLNIVPQARDSLPKDIYDEIELVLSNLFQEISNYHFEDRVTKLRTALPDAEKLFIKVDEFFPRDFDGNRLKANKPISHTLFLEISNFAQENSRYIYNKKEKKQINEDIFKLGLLTERQNARESLLYIMQLLAIPDMATMLKINNEEIFERLLNKLHNQDDNLKQLQRSVDKRWLASLFTALIFIATKTDDDCKIKSTYSKHFDSNKGIPKVILEIEEDLFRVLGDFDAGHEGHKRRRDMEDVITDHHAKQNATSRYLPAKSAMKSPKLVDILKSHFSDMEKRNKDNTLHKPSSPS